MRTEVWPPTHRQYQRRSSALFCPRGSRRVACYVAIVAPNDTRQKLLRSSPGARRLQERRSVVAAGGNAIKRQSNHNGAITAGSRRGMNHGTTPAFRASSAALALDEVLGWGWGRGPSLRRWRGGRVAVGSPDSRGWNGEVSDMLACAQWGRSETNTKRLPGGYERTRSRLQDWIRHS